MVVMWFFVPIAALLAGFFQLLGYSGTCTQNDIDPFATGALLSLPLLGVGYLGAGRALWAASQESSHRAGMKFGIGFATVAVIAAVWIYANAETWIETLLFFGSPCGPDYFERGSGVDPAHLLIGFVYGPMHVVLGIMAIAVVFKSMPFSALRHNSQEI